MKSLLKELFWAIIITLVFTFVLWIRNSFSAEPVSLDEFYKQVNEMETQIEKFNKGEIITFNNGDRAIEKNGAIYIIGSIKSPEEEAKIEIYTKRRTEKREKQIEDEITRKHIKDIEQIRANAVYNYLMGQAINYDKLAIGLANEKSVIRSSSKAIIGDITNTAYGGSGGSNINTNSATGGNSTNTNSNRNSNSNPTWNTNNNEQVYQSGTWNWYKSK